MYLSDLISMGVRACVDECVCGCGWRDCGAGEDERMWVLLDENGRDMIGICLKQLRQMSIYNCLSIKFEFKNLFNRQFKCP